MKAKILSFAIAFITLLSSNNAIAQNVVVKMDPYAVDLGKDLKLCIDFAGLGNISSVGITVSYTADVYTLCYNKGQDKKDGGPVPGLTKNIGGSETISFPVHNGRAKGCKPLGLTFTAGSCPSGNMRGEVSDVVFTNISITVNGKTFSLDDPDSVQ
jgi:hypothetical protein